MTKFRFDESKAIKVRKKPVVVEAYQTDKALVIPTLEGDHHASPGDWIIRGVKGECYPCKPDIFKQTYEIVDDPDNDDHADELEATLRKS
jgi:hypothetical protein